MFFFKKKSIAADFSFLGADMHNHILPGIDDGAPDTDTSLLLLSELYDLGFSKVIPTPHTYTGIYPNTHETIQGAYLNVQNAIKDSPNQLPIVDHFASEYMVDDNFSILRAKKETLSFGKDRVLVEMSFADNAPMLLDEIFQLQLQGKVPVLAHPERYPYLFGQIDYFKQLVGMGCELQLNLLSLLDHYGKGPQKTALKLIENQLYCWAGSDAHHTGHINLLRTLTETKTFQKIINYPFYNKGLL